MFSCRNPGAARERCGKSARRREIHPNPPRKESTAIKQKRADVRAARRLGCRILRVITKRIIHFSAPFLRAPRKAAGKRRFVKENPKKSLLTKAYRVCYFIKASGYSVRMMGHGRDRGAAATPKGNAEALRRKDRTRTTLRKVRLAARRRCNLYEAVRGIGETLRS